VAEAQGHHQQAMTYLRSARGKLLGLQSSNSTQTPTVGGVLAADNPFVGVSRTPAATRTASAYGQYMPWQVAQVSTGDGSTLPGIQRTDLPVETAQTRMLRQVDTMMESLQEKPAPGCRGHGGARPRRRIRHQQADRDQNAADLVLFAVWRLAFRLYRDADYVERRDRQRRRLAALRRESAIQRGLQYDFHRHQRAGGDCGDDRYGAHGVLCQQSGGEALSGLGTLNAADFNATTSSGMENLAKLGAMIPGRSPAIWLLQI
jgi:hypothetical protein